MDYSQKFSLWLNWINKELLLSVGGRYLIFRNTRQQVVAVYETHSGRFNSNDLEDNFGH